jgi:hypothetical protein
MQAARRFQWSLVPFGVCLVTTGCANFWDDVTSREFTFNSLFAKPNPMLVLRDSTDGDKRARALAALHEPKQFGGTDDEQNAVVKILTTAACAEKQPLCRLASIEALGHFKDARAVDGLIAAFYQANNFAPETTTVIRCQALVALGETKNPSAVELLARVVREPPAEGTEVEKQQTLDVRIAAARALANFSHYQATEALVHVLQNDKDVALRDRAHESLQVSTGKNLPADAKAWEEFLHQPDNKAVPPEPAKKLNVVGWFSTKG